MSNRASILHRNLISHFVVDLKNEIKELRPHLQFNFVDDFHFDEHEECGSIPKHFLGKVRPIEGVDAVGPNHSPLQVDL